FDLVASARWYRRREGARGLPLLVEALFDAQVVVGAAHRTVPGDRHRRLPNAKNASHSWRRESGACGLAASGHILSFAVAILGGARAGVNPGPAAFVFRNTASLASESSTQLTRYTPWGTTIEALGRHLLIELHECDRSALDDLDLVRDTLVEAAFRLGST